MQKYNKYIEYVKNAFKNSFEKAGGNNYRFYHCINTANIAKYIAKELNLSEKETEIVILAALLHDIGKIEQIQENGFLDRSSVYEALHNLERHENVSARMVYDILKDDFSKDIIDTVANIIKDDMQDNILAHILHDADDISELGYMNVIRLFTYNHDKSIEHITQHYLHTDKQKKEKKLEKLHFDISRKLANERLAKTEDFLIKLHQEIGLIK